MNKIININFERATLSVKHDDDLERFLKTLKRESCRDEDIHVFHAYFQLFWPIKSVILNSTVKNFPQKFINYAIVSQSKQVVSKVS